MAEVRFCLRDLSVGRLGPSVTIFCYDRAEVVPKTGANRRQCQTGFLSD